jgi:hypothetical protein
VAFIRAILFGVAVTVIAAAFIAGLADLLRLPLALERAMCLATGIVIGLRWPLPLR